MATFHENLVQSFHNFRDKYLKANGKYFKFSYNSTKQKYGYLIDNEFNEFSKADFIFDTWAEYQTAYSAGDIPVGSVVYIKEGSTDDTITALQVVYNNGSVKSALDEINSDLTPTTYRVTGIMIGQVDGSLVPYNGGYFQIPIGVASGRITKAHIKGLGSADPSKFTLATTPNGYCAITQNTAGALNGNNMMVFTLELEY